VDIKAITRALLDILILLSATALRARSEARPVGVETPPSAKPKVMTVEACLDCILKHVSTSKVLVREAKQRLAAGEVKEALEKLRGAFEELTGAEDDATAPGAALLSARIREVRKWFFDSGVLVRADESTAEEAGRRVSGLLDEVYRELEARKERLLEVIGL